MPEKLSELSDRRRATDDLSDLPEDELERLIRNLEQEMRDAAVDLRFEYAARLRDEVKDLKRELRDALAPSPVASRADPDRRISALPNKRSAALHR